MCVTSVCLVAGGTYKRQNPHCGSRNLSAKPHRSISKLPYKLVHNCSNKDASDKKIRILTSVDEEVLAFPVRQYQCLNPHQSQKESEMKQNRMQCTSGSMTKHNLLFSDRKTRLRWHHSSRCNKATLSRL